jgi:hypothetical protein
VRVFLDEPGDFAPGEKFFELEELLEIEAAGNDQHARRGNAVLMENLDAMRRTWS